MAISQHRFWAIPRRPDQSPCITPGLGAEKATIEIVVRQAVRKDAGKLLECNLFLGIEIHCRSSENSCNAIDLNVIRIMSPNSGAKSVPLGQVIVSSSGSSMSLHKYGKCPYVFSMVSLYLNVYPR